MDETNWYYASGGQQRGPVSLRALRDRVRRGELGAADLIWREGMDNWQAAQSVAEVWGPEVEAVPLPDRDVPDPAVVSVDPSESTFGGISGFGGASAGASGGFAGLGAPASGPAVVPGYYSPRPAPPSSTLATAALVLGIASLTTCWVPGLHLATPVAALLAIIFGAVARGKAIRGEAAGRGMAVAGILLGIIYFVLVIVILAIFVIVAVNRHSTRR